MASHFLVERGDSSVKKFSLEEKSLHRAHAWLAKIEDQKTRREVEDLIKKRGSLLIDAFYQDLAFGTGGLRGIMGVGTNRMNKYTVARITQGLACYLGKRFTHLTKIHFAIAYDSRRHSQSFAETIAAVLAENGIGIYLFEALRPTPELSFAVRHLKCQGGIVVTASHNPKEYNGYKIYNEDGSQIVDPEDRRIMEEIKKAPLEIPPVFSSESPLVRFIGSDIDEVYWDKITSLSFHRDVNQRQRDICIVYTPLHGTGITAVPACLKRSGFDNIHLVEEQKEPNGDFPTVRYPNPEESETLALAMKKAREVKADLLLATDPDSDRVGVAVKDAQGNHVLLNGNEIGALLFKHIFDAWKERGRISGREFVVKTIVTSRLLGELARYYGVECLNVLTGFKHIAATIRRLEGKKIFIAGAEESYGYLTGDFVRDKDAVSASCLIAELTALARERESTPWKTLLDIYHRFGFYQESSFSITEKGKKGTEKIHKQMELFRSRPPEVIDGSPVLAISDYLNSEKRDIATGQKTALIFPSSNMIQFLTRDETLVTVRPSGTEPKIKFYFSAKTDLPSPDDYPKIHIETEGKITRIKKELALQ